MYDVDSQTHTVVFVVSRNHNLFFKIKIRIICLFVFTSSIENREPSGNVLPETVAKKL